MEPDRFGETGQPLLVEVASRLLRVGPYAIRVDLDQRGPGSVGLNARSAGGCLHGRTEQRVEAPPQPTTARHRGHAGPGGGNRWAPVRLSAEAAVEVGRQLRVGGRTPRRWVVEIDGKSVAGSFAEADVAWDERGQQVAAEAGPHLIDHLVGEGEAAVEEGHDDPRDAQMGFRSRRSRLMV